MDDLINAWYDLPKIYFQDVLISVLPPMDEICQSLSTAKHLTE